MRVNGACCIRKVSNQAEDKDGGSERVAGPLRPPPKHPTNQLVLVLEPGGYIPKNWIKTYREEADPERLFVKVYLLQAI